MLSGETATGDHPALAVSMMSRIAMEAETSPFFEQARRTARAPPSVAEAIARGACNTAREIGAKYIVAFTESGSSAMTVSLARPDVPIIAYSPNAKTRRRMALYWGVVPREMPAVHDTDQLVDWCTGDLLAGGFGVTRGARRHRLPGRPSGSAGAPTRSACTCWGRARAGVEEPGVVGAGFRRRRECPCPSGIPAGAGIPHRRRRASGGRGLAGGAGGGGGPGVWMCLRRFTLLYGRKWRNSWAPHVDRGRG